MFVSEIIKANQTSSVLLMFVGMQMGSSSASGVDDLLWGQPQCPEHWWQYAITHMCRQQSGMCLILRSVKIKLAKRTGKAFYFLCASGHFVPVKNDQCA